MTCLLQIVLIYIAFAIHPVFGTIWLIAQIVGGLNNSYDDDSK